MWYIKSLRQRLPNSLPSKEESNRNVRLELARRLHDGPAQELIALGYKLDEVIASPDLSPIQRKKIREARLYLIELTQGLRDELYLLEHISLQEALEEIAIILVGVEVSASLPLDSLEAREENVIAQILLELARNCARHSKARNFWIKHEYQRDCLTLTIGNDGAVPISLESRSLGLRLVTEQANLIDATIELRTELDVYEYKLTLRQDPR